MIAKIERSWATDYETRAIINVSKILDLNTITDCEKPDMTGGEKTISCLCWNSGSISATLKTNK